MARAPELQGSRRLAYVLSMARWIVLLMGCAEIGSSSAYAQVVGDPIELWSAPAGTEIYSLEAAADNADGLVLAVANGATGLELWAVRVGPSGLPVGPATVLQAVDDSLLAMRATSGGFVAVVDQEILRIVDGAVAERGMLATDSARTDLASDDGTVLAVFSTGHIPRSFFTRRVAVGGLLTPDESVYIGGIGGTGGVAHIARRGSDAMLIWLSCEGAGFGCALVLQPLSGTGVPSAAPVTLPRTTERWEPPLIGSNADRYVAVALEGSSTARIVAAPIAATGRPEGRTTRELPPGENEALSALVETPTGWVSTYQQQHSLLSTSTRAAFLDVMGAFVGSADTLVVDARSTGSSALVLGGRPAVVTAERDDDGRVAVRLRFLGPLLEPSQPCAANGVCRSGFCADGVCCASDCGSEANDCHACTVAAGGFTDGTCTPLRDPAAVVCRPLAGECDVAEEVCAAGALYCPVDVLRAGGEVCRPAAGVCDVEELCDGERPSCPFDRLADAGDPCREAAGPCDVVDWCTGISIECPADRLWVVGAICRASSGPCDTSEMCDGVSSACPEDLLAADDEGCDDGNPCTAGDVCLAGVCSGAPACMFDGGSVPSDAGSDSGVDASVVGDVGPTGPTGSSCSCRVGRGYRQHEMICVLLVIVLGSNGRTVRRRARTRRARTTRVDGEATAA
jgi:hypothetical protein